jgi:HSP20 family protein
MVTYYMNPVPRMHRHVPVGFNGGQRMPVDIRLEDETYVITAIAPGVKAEDLKIEIHEDVLTLRGEMRQADPEDANYLLQEMPQGEFCRSLRLPDPVDAAKAEARLTDGVLTLRLPKAEGARPKQIKVKTA